MYRELGDWRPDASERNESRARRWSLTEREKTFFTQICVSPKDTFSPARLSSHTESHAIEGVFWKAAKARGLEREPSRRIPFVFETG